MLIVFRIAQTSTGARVKNPSDLSPIIGSIATSTSQSPRIAGTRRSAGTWRVRGRGVVMTDKPCVDGIGRMTRLPAKRL
jgi:hypothetical protein